MNERTILTPGASVLGYHVRWILQALLNTVFEVLGVHLSPVTGSLSATGVPSLGAPVESVEPGFGRDRDFSLLSHTGRPNERCSDEFKSLLILYIVLPSVKAVMPISKATAVLNSPYPSSRFLESERSAGRGD